MRLGRLQLRVLTILSLAPLAYTQGPPPPPPPLLPPPVPAGNPITTAKTNLGKALFWDEQLSTSGTVACGTCHSFDAGGSDARTHATNAESMHPGNDGVLGTADDILGSPGTSLVQSDGRYLFDPTYRLGAQVTSRKSPSVINAAYPPTLFWDGRADGSAEDPVSGALILANGGALESQIAGPPVSSVEMGHVGADWTGVAAKIADSTPLRLSPQVPAALVSWIAGRDYPALFQEAFGTSDVTASRIMLAIATYERTLFSNQAPIDQFVQGQPPPLTQQELRGQQIFGTIGRCIACHPGPRLTNDTFRYIGVRPQNEDLGRFNVTGNPQDRGRMKVPTLRNVELRAPYFHNGEMATLEDVVDFYDRGGDFNAPNLDPAIAPIGLSAQQKADLVAFLKRPLTDPRVVAQSAPFDAPALYAGSKRTPVHFGEGAAGSGGFVPEIVAQDPPVVGNQRFAIGVDRGTPGKLAMLVIASGGESGGMPFRGPFARFQLGTTMRIVRIGALHGAGAGNGFGSASIPIPNDGALIGQTVRAQWIVLDATSNSRVSYSDAVAMTYF